MKGHMNFFVFAVKGAFLQPAGLSFPTVEFP